jgi:SAM-dependent methyltransferase
VPVHEWEIEGENWLRWARTPDHDAYWFYRDAFFDRLLPAAGRRTLEIACGEGRVVRDLEARGHRVTAVDISAVLLRHARNERATAVFARADGAVLPFRDASFDLVVAYNSLQVVADLGSTVREAARVLAPAGTLAICVGHPMTDVGGHFSGGDPDAPYVLRPDYFRNEWVDDTVERDGLTMRFTGWTYSLEDYAIALEEAGLDITALREPWPTGDNPRYERRKRVPMFLLIRAAKRP